MALYSDINTFSPKKRILFEDVLAIQQNIINIVQTVKGERLFNLDIGIVSKRDLFELMDEKSIRSIFNSTIQEVIDNEPRVIVDRSDSRAIPNATNHTVDIQVVFEIKNMEGEKFSVTGTVG